MATSSVRIEMNSAGARAILRSPEVFEDLERRAATIAAAAGGEPDFVVVRGRSSNRARVLVITKTPEGRKAEAETRALTRALDAGR